MVAIGCRRRRTAIRLFKVTQLTSSQAEPCHSDSHGKSLYILHVTGLLCSLLVRFKGDPFATLPSFNHPMDQIYGDHPRLADRIRGARFEQLEAANVFTKLNQLNNERDGANLCSECKYSPFLFLERKASVMNIW